MTTQLNYQDKFGYFGLRVDPSYEQMLRTVNKQIRIPVPDRAAKWYALGPYRAFLLEQAKRYNDSQRADLAYDDTGAHLPAAAARAQHGSMAGTDDTWDNVSKYTSDLNGEEARQLAEEAMASEKRAQANGMRRQQLGAYGPSKSHWTITAHHEDLTERNVPHQAPTPKMAMPTGRWRAPPNELAADGYPQAPEFPTWEQLNMGYSKDYKLGRPAPLQTNRNYQQLRENYLGMTK
jgi:hypothetical protein